MKRVGEDTSAYYEAKAKLPEPDGVHCVICGQLLPKRKQKYCSDKCFSNWSDSLNIRSWSHTRWKAFERDNFKCRMCGVQKAPEYITINGKEYMKAYPELVGDHILPIALGGEEFDLENVQTLCVLCNAIKTKRDLAKINKLKRGMRQEPNPFLVTLFNLDSVPNQTTLLSIFQNGNGVSKEFREDYVR